MARQHPGVTEHCRARGNTIARNSLDLPVKELIRLNREVSSAEPVTLKDAERVHILRTLERTNGQLAGAAVLLGIPRSTLFYRIRRLGIILPPHKARAASIAQAS